ncbi:lyase family protein [Oceanicella actignis]|uniref:lyase family protein n=1 Tax=Oceanicella actignis TaxID=1189325 RepID=UPI0011E7A035|nr:lyase family protein [Oceanicella actignis]TYO88519.1 3-carboxy-cis,cis-muconate cycloisomerase [Oceanicella actignis]
MAVSPFDSALLRDLFGAREVAALFSDAAELRAILLFEGALAEAQGALGVIPAEAAAAIARAAREVTLDPGALAARAARDGTPVPAAVEAFRAAMGAPEHAAYVHFGATSQDAADTGLALRLRRALALIEAQLDDALRALAAAARANRALPMAARTRGRIAAPTTFGARVASWGWPLLRARARMAQLRPRLLTLSLGGAAGTLAALGPQAEETARRMAESLGLEPAPAPWHSARDPLAELAFALAALCGALGKMGRDVALMGQDEVAELRAGAGGGSSTMPHKANPVGPEALVTLARLTARLAGSMNDALLHEGERDGAAWALEWHALPQLCVGAAGGLRHAAALAADLRPDPARMAANLGARGGLAMAEAASFALARSLPRPQAQALVKRACAEALARGIALAEALETLHPAPAPEGDWAVILAPERWLGMAPALADRFADAVEDATGPGRRAAPEGD